MPRRMLIALACLLIAWSAWPAHADEDAASLKARVAALEQERAALLKEKAAVEKALALTLQQNKQLATSRDLAMQTLETVNQVVREQQRNAELRQRSHAKALSEAGVRRQWLEMQLKQAVEALETERKDAIAYYGSLFAELGTGAAQVLVARLHQDPVAHAPRVAAVLARMGPQASAARPTLEKILAGLDAKHAEARTHLQAAIKAVGAP